MMVLPCCGFWRISPGVSCEEAVLDDEQVMSLFNSSDALHLDPDKLKIDIPVGTLGIPEFGTSFVKQMLLETRSAYDF